MTTPSLANDRNAFTSNSESGNQIAIFSFSELSDDAKAHARVFYRDGWLETHPEAIVTYENDDDLVSEDGDARFDSYGNYIAI